MRRVVTTNEEETEAQLMKRLSDTYDMEQLVDQGPPKTTTTPVTKPKQKRPIIDSNSESDSDTETKMSAIRQMMESPPVRRQEDIADRVKTRPRKTATRPKMKEPVAEIVVEGNQLKMKSTYLRPRIVQPGYTVQVPGILWEFSSDAPVPN